LETAQLCGGRQEAKTLAEQAMQIARTVNVIRQLTQFCELSVNSLFTNCTGCFDGSLSFAEQER
jgi:hypothetical protein